MSETLSGDELAGIVGMFGTLTRDELKQACVEITYKQAGEAPPDDEIDATIDAALEAYELVVHPTEPPEHLLPGPAAFPTLPAFADDLPVMLDVEERSADRTEAARAIVAQLGTELDGDIDADRRAFIEQLSYDIEAWADVDAEELRGET